MNGQRTTQEAHLKWLEGDWQHWLKGEFRRQQTVRERADNVRNREIESKRKREEEKKNANPDDVNAEFKKRKLQEAKEKEEETIRKRNIQLPVGPEAALIANLQRKATFSELAVKKEVVSADILVQRIFLALKRDHNEFSLPMLASHLKVDLDGREDVIAKLAASPRIVWNSLRQTAKYNPKVLARNIDELLQLVLEYSSEGTIGVRVIELLESYPNVLNDVETLHQQKRVLRLCKSEKDIKNEDILIAANPSDVIPINDEFKKMWHDVEIKSEVEMSEYLKLHRIAEVKSLTRARPVVTTKSGRKKRKMKKRNLKNTHLPDAQLDQIKKRTDDVGQ